MQHPPDDAQQRGVGKVLPDGLSEPLAFWPQASENSWLSKAASSCGPQGGHGRVNREAMALGEEEGQGLLETGADGSTAPLQQALGVKTWGGGVGVCLREVVEQKRARREAGRGEGDQTAMRGDRYRERGEGSAAREGRAQSRAGTLSQDCRGSSRRAPRRLPAWEDSGSVWPHPFGSLLGGTMGPAPGQGTAARGIWGWQLERRQAGPAQFTHGSGAGGARGAGTLRPQRPAAGL